MSTNKKTILYSRVSTEEQARGGYSLTYQKNRLLTYCQENQIVDYSFYEDAGFSAKNTNRPFYQKLINEIIGLEVKEIIFLKIDRISRNIKDYHILCDLCQRYNVSLISLSEDIKFNATSEFSQNIIISLAEMERKQISERTKSGFVAMLEEEKYPFGGKLPLGISKDENKKLYFNKDISKVKYIFSLFAKGFSFQEITRLYARKYNTHVYKNFIENIIKNDLYKGYVLYNSKKYYLLKALPLKNQEKKVFDYKQRNRTKYNYLLKPFLKDFKVRTFTYFSKLKKKTIYYKYYIHKQNPKCIFKENELLAKLQEKVKDFNFKNKQLLKKKIAKLKQLYIISNMTLDEYSAGKQQIEKNIDLISIKENINSIQLHKHKELIVTFKNNKHKIKLSI